jgi:glycosyltransferase involved in cell wall biosynthesis
MIPPRTGGATTPYWHAKELSRRWETHYATVSPCDDWELARLSSDPEIAGLFASITRVRYRERAPRWRSGLNALRGRPFFVQDVKQPQLVREARQVIDGLVRARGITHVIAEGIAAIQYVPPRLLGSTVGMVLDLASLKSAREIAVHRAQLPLRRRMVHVLTTTLTAEYEQLVFPSLGATVFVSSLDSATALRRVPTARLETIPLGCDTAFFRPDACGDVAPVANRIGFLGAMSYDPNADAVEHFARDVLPLIRARLPEAHFVAVGGPLTPELARLHDGGSVTLTGYVDDVRPHLLACSLLVSPLRYGAGMKNKLLIGLALGRPMVVSPVTCEGFDDLSPGRHAVVADGPRETARAVIELLKDPARRAGMARFGRDWVKARYSWEAAGERIAALLESLPPAGA